jgi:hypothetical protein
MTKFVATIEWPNGLGYTPCTPEYLEKKIEQELLKPDDVPLDALSPADYNRWHHLQNDLDNMLASGQHVGKSVRYG